MAAAAAAFRAGRCLALPAAAAAAAAALRDLRCR